MEASLVGSHYVYTPKDRFLSQPDLETKLQTFDSKKLIKWLAWIFTTASMAIGTIFWLYFTNFTGELSKKNDVWGTFGDFIGGTLNPILSFFALIALLLTIVLQSRELEATREELSRSATAHENSEKVMAEQHKTLHKQKFETTFFSLLELHNQSLNKVTEKREQGSGTSRSVVSDVWTWVFNKDELEQAKEMLKEESEGPIGEYYRVLFQLLKFIVTNSPEIKDQNLSFSELLKTPITNTEKMYSNMVRAFIPNNVLQLLAVNCHCDNESDSYWSYKLLIERYQFLEHMPFNIGYKGEQVLLTLLEYYDNAFGNSDYIPARVDGV